MAELSHHAPKGSSPANPRARATRKPSLTHFLLAMPRGCAPQVDSMRGTVARLSTAAEAAREEYERVAQRNESELSAFKVRRPWRAGV